MLNPADLYRLARDRKALQADGTVIALFHAQQSLPDAGWDSFDDAPTDFSGNPPVSLSYIRQTERVFFQWTSQLAFSPFQAGLGTLQGDALLFLSASQRPAFEALFRHPDSHIEIDGRKMRILALRPSYLNLPYEYVAEFKLFTQDGE